MRRIVVGYSMGVTSAWCAGWALDNYPKEEVVFLFHDTKEEDADTYRFGKEMADKLGHPITERSDGRSVTELFYEENAIANDQMAFCSRILKTEQRDRYFKELRAEGVTDIRLVLGFSSNETKRIQRATMRAEKGGYRVLFPLAALNVSKQQCADYCAGFGICLPSMYTWSDHANCVGCVRGGKAYWLAVAEHAPAVFKQRLALEKEFGHTIINDISLEQLVQIGLKRKVNRREAIEIGPCDCGD